MLYLIQAQSKAC